MADKPTSPMIRRLNVVVFAVIIAFVVWIVGHLFATAVTQSDKYKKLANETQFSTVNISASRGSIFDANGELLAASATVYKVFVDPSLYQKYDTANLDLITSTLSEKLDIEESKVTQALGKTSSQYEVLKSQVEQSVVDEIYVFIEEYGIRCISTVEDTKRYYPQNELAASVIGFTNGDGVGQYGIEFQYDDELTGIDGRIITATDANGDEMAYEYKKLYEAQNGSDLYLTLDINLQYYLEKNLADVVEDQIVAQRTCGIIMDCNTGAILAMATVPGFDLNNPGVIYDPNVQAQLDLLSDEDYQEAYVAAREMQWKNKCITEIYYPGSVFKVITGSMALEEQAISLTDAFSCGDTNVSGTTFHCWKASGHGTQNFFEALANSCNPAFISISDRLGARTFSDYFEAFGLTERTGIDLPFEATSIYQGYNGMGPVELASCSFGQTNKVTPLQMITSYAACINGGYLVTPYVVDKIVDSDGNVTWEHETDVIRQVISEETSETMRAALENVVETNGGSNAYIKGYSIGGKSGTSQKQDENNAQGRDDLYVASYCCFTPAYDPDIIMLIMVDEPTTGDYYASIVAVPTARAIMTDILPYLGYYPEYTEEELLTLDIAVPSLADLSTENAVLKVQGAGFNYEIIGEGDSVYAQMPPADSKMPADGTVYIYTEAETTQEPVTVPDLTGMSLYQANATLASVGLNYTLTGASSNTSATVHTQSISYGENVAKGSIIELYFAIDGDSG
ncbi:MAG: PASTA domain-containing protein [Oscillospiraceae bacterium]|nr:PASTA domain-containing protein [Oscillospiraceae bacterium]